MNEHSPLDDQQPEPTPPPSEASLWEDFLDIFYAPSEVFARRQAGGWWPSLVVLVVVATLLFAAWQQVLGPVLDAEMQRAMAENPDLTAENMQQMSGLGRAFGIIGFAIAFPASIALIGLLLWALGKLFGSVATVSSLIMVATYSQVVRLVQYVLGILQGAVLDVTRMDSVQDVSLGLARFLDPEAVGAAAFALAGRVEVFTIWATVLLAIGLHVVGRVPKGSAYLAAFLLWAIAALPQVIGPLLSGA